MMKPLKGFRKKHFNCMVKREDLNLVCSLPHSCHLVQVQCMLMCMKHPGDHVCPDLDLKVTAGT